MLTIATLTLREAVRRRVLASAAVLTVLAIAFSTWGIWRLHATMLTRMSAASALASFAIVVLLLAYMFSIILSAGSAFIAAPAIASEVESGVVLAMLPRPIRRSDIVLGKWLALALLIVVFTLVVGSVELGVVRFVTGFGPPHPLRGLGFIAAEAVLLMTLALLLGTRLPAVAAAIVTVVLFGITWAGGIAQAIALTLHNQSVLNATTAINLLLPTDALWRSAAFALEPVALAAAAVTDLTRQSPFIVGSAPPPAMLYWSVVWLGAALVAAVISFQRRDL
jgi:ABC-type transport system involved in multi-copper enzyme maturation permease subunit